MLKKLPVLAALALLVLTGLLHGRITDRWGYSGDLQSAVEKLNHLPLLIGDWDGTIVETKHDAASTKGVGAFSTIRYINRLNGDAVNMTLVAGRPGPLSLHPPTICFPAHGYSQKDAPARKRLALAESGQADFMFSEFGRPVGAVQETTRIYWSFGVHGAWTVPDNPRVALARNPAVYKLYCFTQSLNVDRRHDEESASQFIGLYLPELKKVLWGE
jgi:hypothetical protein